MPPCNDVPPLNVLLPDRMSTPSPVFVSVPAPMPSPMAPLSVKVVAALTFTVPPAALIAPALVSVRLFAPGSSVPPLKVIVPSPSELALVT